jgi:hypothetical protein
MEVDDHLHIQPALPQGKNPLYPFERRVDGPQNWSEQHGEEKILDHTGTKTPSITQTVTSNYTDHVTPAPVYNLSLIKFLPFYCNNIMTYLN